MGTVLIMDIMDLEVDKVGIVDIIRLDQIPRKIDQRRIHRMI